MMDGYCLSTMSRPQLHQRNKVTGEWEMMKDLIVLFCFVPVPKLSFFFPPHLLRGTPPVTSSNVDMFITRESAGLLFKMG